jgi:hypothetical protein
VVERSCNESCALRLIDRREVNPGTQFNSIAQGFENLGGCAISIRSPRDQAAIAALFRVVNRYLDNLASMPSFFRTLTSAEASRPGLRPCVSGPIADRSMEAPPAIGGCCRRWRSRPAPNGVGRIESLIADGAVTMTDVGFRSATARNSWCADSISVRCPILRSLRRRIAAQSEPREEITSPRGTELEPPPNIRCGSAGSLCRESWMPPASAAPAPCRRQS